MRPVRALLDAQAGVSSSSSIPPCSLASPEGLLDCTCQATAADRVHEPGNDLAHCWVELCSLALPEGLLDCTCIA